MATLAGGDMLFPHRRAPSPVSSPIFTEPTSFSLQVPDIEPTARPGRRRSSSAQRYGPASISVPHPRPRHGSTWQSIGPSHIDVPRKFGEAADYWKLYDQLAETQDKELIRSLRDNLDVLPTFAGLFSAVNTAFIVLSLADLSPLPDARIVQLLDTLTQGQGGSNATKASEANFSPSSQSVRVNSFLLASLTCSLLAAFGAVMARQWVLHYSHQPRGMLPESRGRMRQKKLNGLEKYRMQQAVESLPVLLQLSLLLFFVGLVDFLYSLNQTVSLVVLAFSLAGLLAYIWSFVMAAVDPLCPYQSSVSRFVQKAARFRYISKNLTKLKLLLKGKNGQRPSSIGIHLLPPVATLHALGPEHIKKYKPRRMDSYDLSVDLEDGVVEGVGDVDTLSNKSPAGEDDTIDNQTACWIVETSENKEALLAVARNIPSLRKIESTGLNIDGVAFDRLFSLFKESLAAWRASSVDGSSNQSRPLDGAVVYGRALCHAVVGSRGDGTYFAYRAQDLQWPRWRKNIISGPDTNEFILMKMCVRAVLAKDFCLTHRRDTMPRPSSALPIYIAALLEPAVENRGFRIAASRLDRITMIQWLISMCLTHTELCFPGSVNLSAWALAELPALLSSPQLRIDDRFRQEWWGAYTNDCDLYQNVIKALEVYHHYERLPSALPHMKGSVSSDFISLVTTRDYVETYTLLVKAARNIIATDSRSKPIPSERTLELDTALRQTTLTVETQMDTVTELEVADDTLTEALEDLRTELMLTIKELRRNGVEAVLPQADAPHTDSVSLTITDEAQSLQTLRQSRHLPSVVTQSLLGRHPGLKYMALSILHDYASDWFEADEDLNRRFMQARLLPALRGSAESLEHFELVGGIMAKLILVNAWKAEFASAGTLEWYQAHAKRVLDSDPTFRRLEVYFEVWKSYHEHPGLKEASQSFITEQVVFAVPGWFHGATHRKGIAVPQPYVPAAFLEYVEVVKQVEGIRMHALDGLESACQELKRLSTASSWLLEDT